MKYILGQLLDEQAKIIRQYTVISMTSTTKRHNLSTYKIALNLDFVLIIKLDNWSQTKQQRQFCIQFEGKNKKRKRIKMKQKMKSFVLKTLSKPINSMCCDQSLLYTINIEDGVEMLYEEVNSNEYIDHHCGLIMP